MHNERLNLAISRLTGIGLALVAVCSPAATLVVTSNNDSGAGTLRQSIATATSGDTITFDPALNGSVIALTSGQLVISNKNMTVQGPGPGLLAINGNGTDRVFLIQNTVASARYYVTINGLTLTNGFASSASAGGAAGGAIRTTTGGWNYYLTTTISNCIVRANKSTTSSYEGGGGICSGSTGDTMTLIDCEILDNSAISYGGGGVWARGGITVLRCTFSGNKTSDNGAGLLVRGGTGVIQSSTFSGNSATNNNGGAIYCQEKNALRIYNSTITTNSAKKIGGGIYLSFNTTNLLLNSTIVAGNIDMYTNLTQDVYGDPLGLANSPFVGATNCLIQATNGVALPGVNNIYNQSALLEPLANNGGLTRTHALKRKSPAIDHGYNPLNLSTDQRGAGFPRLLGTAVDIGSYEFVPLPGATVIIIR